MAWCQGLCLALFTTRVYEGGNGGDMVRSCLHSNLCTSSWGSGSTPRGGEWSHTCVLLEDAAPQCIVTTPPQVQGMLMTNLCIPMREELTCFMK